MSDQDPVRRKLELEWYAAIATLVIGFIVALAVAAYLTFSGKPATQTASTAAPTAGVQSEQVRKAELIKFFEEFCQLQLTAAKSFGIVPDYGKLASPIPRKTDIKGRYVCLAATDAVKYQLVGDIMCGNLRDPRCTSLFTVSQEDGTVLYQRQN